MPIPEQFSSSAGTVTGAIDGVNDVFSFSPAGPSQRSILFRNGLMMTQPGDGVTQGNQLIFNPNQTPQLSDTVTAEAWIADPAAGAPPVSLPTQFTTVDGTLIGPLDGQNRTFALATDRQVTDLIVAWNGDGLTQDVDYTWLCAALTSEGQLITQFTMTTDQAPGADDILTVQAFFI